MLRFFGADILLILQMRDAATTVQVALADSNKTSAILQLVLGAKVGTPPSVTLSEHVNLSPQSLTETARLQHGGILVRSLTAKQRSGHE